MSHPARRLPRVTQGCCPSETLGVRVRTTSPSTPDVEQDRRQPNGLKTQQITAARLADLPSEELLALVERALGGGIAVTFSGKANAARIASKVRPRVVREVQKLSIGSPEAQATNRLIEGDNLHAMATLYRERGHVDLILTDPPYNTGNDFRYNDRWETDPNDPGVG